MPDFIDFTEGQNVLLASGLPSTCYFLLSTNAIASFTSATTLAGGVAEITGTGYVRQSQAKPTPASGAAAFSLMSWSTGSATNWPSSVCSVLLVTSSDNSGHAICAWNLVSGGAARNLASPNTTENVTPTLSLS